jgi:hypothetical protein
LADQLFYDLGLYFSKFSEGEEKLARHARTLDTGLNIYGEKPHRLEIERPEIAKDEEGWKEQILVISSKH